MPECVCTEIQIEVSLPLPPEQVCPHMGSVRNAD